MLVEFAVIKIGLTKAKSQFSALIARAKRGETITIMDRGKPAAQIIPPAPESANEANNLSDEVKPAEERDIAAEMLAYRDRRKLTLGPGITYRTLRDEGRRY